MKRNVYKSAKNRNIVVISVFLILSCLVVYRLMSLNKNRTVPISVVKPYPTTSMVTSTPTTSPFQPVLIDSKTLSDGWISWNVKIKTYSYKMFTLNYPKDWVVSAQRGVSTSEYFQITLKKGDFVAVIEQSERGYGTCKFPGDSAEDGMFYSYDSYVAVKENPEWRFAKRSNPNKQTEYTVCSKQTNTSVDNFWEVTSIGGIFAQTIINDQNTVNQFAEILRRIVIN